MKRTFIALELPETFKDEIHHLINDLKNLTTNEVKWVEEQNLHITFQFIGDTRDEDITEISTICGELFSGFDPPELISPRLKIIPGRFPRVIWIEFKSLNQAVFKLSKTLKHKLTSLGYKLENRHLKIHATLGRVKKRLPDKLVEKILATEILTKSILLPGASFYQSILRPQGPLYNIISHYEF